MRQDIGEFPREKGLGCGRVLEGIEAVRAVVRREEGAGEGAVAFLDAGAYGASMSSNYNSRPLLPEFLIENGALRMIRRRQTVQDLLSLETDIIP